MNTNEDLLAVSVKKADDVFIVTFVPSQAREARRQLGRWACHPGLPLTWKDARAAVQQMEAMIRGRT